MFTFGDTYKPEASFIHIRSLISTPVYMGYAVFVSFCPKAELYGPTVVFPVWHK